MSTIETIVDPAGVVLGQDDLLKRSSDKSNGTGLPCRTFDYEQGICLKKEQCYPFTKLHNTPELDTWLGGTKGTCFYSDPSGEQVSRTLQSILIALIRENIYLTCIVYFNVVYIDATIFV